MPRALQYQSWNEAPVSVSRAQQALTNACAAGTVCKRGVSTGADTRGRTFRCRSSAVTIALESTLDERSLGLPPM